MDFSILVPLGLISGNLVDAREETLPEGVKPSTYYRPMKGKCQKSTQKCGSLIHWSVIDETIDTRTGKKMVIWAERPWSGSPTVCGTPKWP
uniref:Uncharacterized protein n=1 Tax=Bionectria ochroleuca TaxID=29856 RepID=A0A0B7K5T8_BIOOC